MLTVAEISRRLSERAEDVCSLLLPGGKKSGNEWLAGDVGGSVGQSLHITLEGDHAGQFKDFANPDDHGDLIDLWRSSRGLTAAEAIKQSKEYLGITDPHVSQRSEKQWAKPAANGEKPLDPNGKALEWLTNHRKIDPSIVHRFRIQGDSKHRAIVFPCYTPSGQLANRSYRTLSEPKKVWQDQGCAPCLFGWQALDEKAYREKTVLLCEGQVDCATWVQWGIPALSIPNGTGMSWLDYSWDDLAAFDTIYLAFDNDPAGSDITEKAINRLGRHRCLVVGLPLKDANEALQRGCTAHDAANWVKEAKAPAVKGLITAEHLESRILRDLESKPTEVWTLPFFRGEDDCSGFYPQVGDVTLWSGFRGDGKTSFLSYLMMSLLAQNQTVFVASLEIKAERLSKRMITAGLGRLPGKQDVSTFIKECGPYLIFCDKIGFINQDELLSMMRYSYQRYGAQHFFVDSLMRISKLEEDYPKQAEFMNSLCEFSKSAGVNVHLVAHPRKPPPGVSGGDKSVKGSSAIENSVDNVAFVVRNRNKDGLSDYDTEIRVTKQRELGYEGSFFLSFDPRHFAYAAIP
jgi:twinkle protein